MPQLRGFIEEQIDDISIFARFASKSCVCQAFYEDAVTPLNPL